MAETDDGISQNHLEDTRFRVRRAFERKVGAGEIVFDEGDSSDAVFVIQAGQVELLRSGATGPQVQPRMGPGEFFGEMGVLLGRPRTHRARAVTEASLLELDVPTFESMCVEQPEIAIRVIQRLATRAIELEQRLAVLGIEDLLRPVVRALLRRAEPEGPGARLSTSLRGLARESGLSVLDAYRALGQLLDRRLVKLVDETLLIPDLDRLTAALDAAA